jgi:hypothetical protein
LFPVDFCNVSTMASRTVGMNLEIYCLLPNLTPVGMFLSVIASFSSGSNGSLKINNSKKNIYHRHLFYNSHIYIYTYFYYRSLRLVLIIHAIYDLQFIIFPWKKILMLTSNRSSS